MKSYTQGDGTGLCGLYAVLNSVHFLFREFSDDDMSSLHAALVRGGPDFVSAYLDGTEMPELRQWISAARDWLSKKGAEGFSIDFPWIDRPPQSKAEWFKGISGLIHPASVVAIVGLNKEPDDDEDGHWTVATHADKGSLHLFDSGGYKAISRRKLSWPDENRSGMWEPDPGAVVVIGRAAEA